MSADALHTVRRAALGALAVVLLGGCGVPNPYAPTSTSSTSSPAPASTRGTSSASASSGATRTTVQASASSTRGPQNPGELPAPAPPSGASQSPARVEATPLLALEQFAGLYTNWTYRTLAGDQRTLAAIAVGEARLSERQAAAASAADSTITRGQIYNQGQLVSVSPALTAPGEWVLVTHERTGGNPAYYGLQAAYHVTLARVAKVRGGFAVSQWQPQT